jgi:hypothetical protein
MHTRTLRDIVEKGLDALGALLGDRLLLPLGDQANGRETEHVTLAFRQGELRRLAVVPCAGKALRNQARPGAGLGGDSILILDHAPAALQETLRSDGINFVDAAGNAHLDLPEAFLDVRGRKPAPGLAAHVADVFTQPTGLKLVHALLARPELLRATQRRMAAAAGVAHGAIPALLGGLKALGLLATVREHDLRLLDVEQWLLRWGLNYGKLRRKLLVGRFMFQGDVAALPGALRLAPAAAPGLPPAVFFGGELAAQALVHGNLRPATATLHVALDHAALREFIKANRLLPAPEGKVAILRTFGTTGYHGEVEAGGQFGVGALPVATPLLLHGELGQIDDTRLDQVKQKVQALVFKAMGNG